MKINQTHIYIFLIVFVLGIGTCKAQFFKYATIYSSGSINTSMIEDQDYIAINIYVFDLLSFYKTFV